MHFLDGKKRGEAEVQTLFVTAEERASAEDIKNANKEEILKKIAEILQQVSDEDIREVLVKKFDLLKVQHSKVKKEHLIMFCNEVIEELQQQAAQDEICITEEEEQEGLLISVCLPTNIVKETIDLRRRRDRMIDYSILY